MQHDRLVKDIDMEANVHTVTPRIPDSIAICSLITRQTSMLVSMDAAPKSTDSRSSNRQTELILDSECTHHMVTNLDLLTNIVLNDHQDSLNLGQVIVGNQALPPILGFGDIWSLGRVLYVPGLVSNLISVRKFTAQGFSVDFIEDSAKVICWISMQTIMTASVALGDLFRLLFVPGRMVYTIKRY